MRSVARSGARRAGGAEARDGGGVTWRDLVSAAPVVFHESTRVVQQLTGRSSASWVLALDEVVTSDEHALFTEMVSRRSAGEPLQYVLGRWGFRTLDLEVGPAALIPRPETEITVEVALREITAAARNLAAPPVVVDLGTGSGAIALSIAFEAGPAWPGMEVWATDVSAGALELARENHLRLDPPVAVRFAAGSFYDALDESMKGSLCLVVSNPPYISENEFDLLDGEVREWEPRIALVAGPTGMEAVEAVVVSAGEWLRPEGSVVVEIAPHQAGRAAALARAAGFSDVDVVEDLTSRERVLVARSPRSDGGGSRHGERRGERRGERNGERRGERNGARSGDRGSSHT